MSGTAKLTLGIEKIKIHGVKEFETDQKKLVVKTFCNDGSYFKLFGSSTSAFHRHISMNLPGPPDEHEKYFFNRMVVYAANFRIGEVDISIIKMAQQDRGRKVKSISADCYLFRNIAEGSCEKMRVGYVRVCFSYEGCNEDDPLLMLGKEESECVMVDSQIIQPKEIHGPCGNAESPTAQHSKRELDLKKKKSSCTNCPKRVQEQDRPPLSIQERPCSTDEENEPEVKTKNCTSCFNRNNTPTVGIHQPLECLYPDVIDDSCLYPECNVIDDSCLCPECKHDEDMV